MNPAPDQPDPTTTPTRVGFICSRPLDEPSHLSGMPYHMARALRAQGLEIVQLCEHPRTSQPTGLTRRLLNRWHAERRRRTPNAWRRFLEDAMPGRTREALLKSVRTRSRNIQSQLNTLAAQGNAPDAIFGCCISQQLAMLHSSLPIIYFSDATYPATRNGYRWSNSRGEAFINTMIKIERMGVSQARSAIFASPAARASAINDLNISPNRTLVVPMGANVTPDDPAAITAPAGPPTRGDCRLLIVAADPVRKRVDLAMEATEILCERGINASLRVIGPGTQRSRSSRAVESYGRLDLADPDDRAIHQRLLRESHLQLLPSIGEAFGIAPIESAHFARPSVVSSAGGLPFVVRDGDTGLVLDRHANAGTWADAVESLIDDPDRYRAMSTAALDRARDELNWDAWGRSMAGIIRRTMTHPTRD